MLLKYHLCRDRQQSGLSWPVVVSFSMLLYLYGDMSIDVDLFRGWYGSMDKWGPWQDCSGVDVELEEVFCR